MKLDASRKETQIGWPEFLPDGRHYIYMVISQKPEDNSYRMGSLDSSETKPFAPAQTMLAYAPPGYLLFVKDRTLMAQRFDAKAMKTSGEPVPLAEQIGTDAVGLARFSVSRDGVLAYRTGESGNRMLWMDRSGKELETLGEPAEHQDPYLSPAGDRLAYDVADLRSGKNDIWIRDLARGVNSRFTFAPGNAYCPVWSPKGDAIVYASDREGAGGLYEKSTIGQGDEKLLLKDEALVIPRSFSPDGRFLALQRRDPKSAWDILILPMTGEARLVPFRVTPFNEVAPEFSPDGRFFAYTSNESGRNEVYVQSYPGPGRYVADLHRRRNGCALAPRRKGALLPGSGPEAHGRRDPRRRCAGGRHPAGAFPGADSERRREHEVPSRSYGTEIPLHRASGPGVPDADDRRAELVRRARALIRGSAARRGWPCGIRSFATPWLSRRGRA